MRSAVSFQSGLAESLPTEWIVVLCPPRSCSTIVTAMLGCHPEMYSFPEFNLLCYKAVNDLLLDDSAIFSRTATRLQYSAGLVRALIAVLELPLTDSGVSIAVNWLEARADWQTHELMAWLTNAIRPRVGVAKSTRAGEHPAALASLKSNLPAIRFIHLLRNPLDTIRSQLRLAGIRDSRSVEHAPYFARVIVHHHRLIDAFLSTLPGGDSVRVRAEDVLADARVLGKVVKQMGRRDDHIALDAMRHPERWQFISRGPISLEAEGDRGFYSAPHLRTTERTLASIPSEWNVDEELSIALAQLATAYGYEAPWIAD